MLLCINKLILYCVLGEMKGDLEYAGHTHKDDRRSPVVSGLGVIAITGLLITITTAGVIFGVHLMNKIDSQSEHLMNTINSQSQQINSQSQQINSQSARINTLEV